MDACKYIYNKYRDEFDTINEVYDIRDYMSVLYEKGGLKKVLNEFFLPGASKKYIKDYLKLINKEDEYDNKTKNN